MKYWLKYIIKIKILKEITILQYIQISNHEWNETFDNNMTKNKRKKNKVKN